MTAIGAVVVGAAAVATAGRDARASTSMRRDESAPVRLVRLSSVPRVLVPIRLACGLFVLGLSLAVGERPRVGLVAFVLGAFAAGALLTGDPRRRRRRWPSPEPLPAGAEAESWRSVVRAGVYPSSVGVTALGLVALAFRPTLAALLGGVLAGMAIASAVVWLEIAALERRLGGALFGERGRDRLYVDGQRG